MFEFHNHAGKRVMAMLLVFAMMFAMLGEYAPSWFTAFAEAVSEDSGSSSSEDRSSDGHESSHSDSGSSGSHESSSHSESSSSSSHESSSSDSGSSSSHASSSSDSGSSGSHESSSSDSGSSSSHESSSSDSSSSGSHESSSSDSGSSSSHESSSSDSGSSSSHETSSSDSSSSSGNASSSSEDDSSSSQETSFSDSSAPSGNASSSSEDGSSNSNEASSSDDADAEDAASEKISSDTSEKPTVSQEDSGVSPSSEDTGSENEQNGASVENVEVTSEGEGASEDSVVSETNEDSAADDSIPVVVWGSSEDGDTADQMEAETAPSEEPTPAEAEGEPTEVGTDDNAPSEESAPLEAAVEEVEALIGETDPADVEAVDSGDGTASEEITPIEGKEEQTENGIEDAEADDQGTVLTLTAALSPAAENSEPAEDEAEAAESEPVFTTQAYTAPVMLASTGTEQEKVCVLQQKINDAMGSVTGTLTGKLKVVLEKNTAYEGTVSIEKGSREVADDFQLEIEAEDAGDDGQQAEGKTTFTGTMSIKGINVAIRGIGLPGKVSVQDAALAYSGTEANDTVNVEVGSGASADIQTAAGDDKVTASAGDDGKLTLDTGAGDDTVTATGKDEAELNIQTGEGGDNVTATIDQKVYEDKYPLFTMANRKVEPISLDEIKDLESWKNIFYQRPDGALQLVKSFEDYLKIAGEKVGNAITVKATDDTRQMLLAGGISVSSGLGAGAAAAVVVSNKTVEARAHDMTANGDVNVTADNHDRLAQLALSVGVSTGTDAGTGGAAVQIGAAIQSLGSKANAVSDGDVTSETGAFNLTANNTTSLTNVAAALALSRDIAATPVFAYTGFSGEATANLKSGTVNAQNGVNVAANSNKEISQYTVGVAASGSVALSGALSVMTLKDQTSALVAMPVDVTSNSMKVNADSDYTLRGASGTLAGSIGNAVALNGMVSVVKANTLAEMAGKANVKASGLAVKASSKRDIINAAATVSAAGTGAISAGVMALVVGDKMDQEAADQLTYGRSTNKDRKLFDADAMIGDLAGRGIDTSAMSGMSDDLSGNGATTDTTTLGHTEGGKQTFDVASGYSDGTDGGSKSASETGDVQRAKQIGSTAYTDSPKDAVIARIAETAEITGGVKVTANQTTLSDLYGASVAVGGDLGGGISIALAKLRSNVLASSTGTIHAEDQDVTIEAISDSASAKLDADEASRSNALIGTLGDKVKPENRTIRAIGLAVGGSLGVGGAVSAAFVRLDNITDATLAGHVEKAKVIDVNGKADYDNILAATIAAGGGTVGIAGSLAIAVADGTVNARLGKNKTAANAVENDGTFSGSGNGGIEKAGNVSVQSVVSGGATNAVIGTSGVSERLKVPANRAF